MDVEGGSPQRKVFWDGQRGYTKLISLESSNCVLAVDNSGVTVDSRGRVDICKEGMAFKSVYAACTWYWGLASLGARRQRRNATYMMGQGSPMSMLVDSKELEISECCKVATAWAD